MAKTYTALTKLVSVPIIAEVVMYFNVVALGLALAWLVTVWASALLAGRRIWDAALIAASPLVIVHVFTNFDPLATAFATGALLAWARRKPCSPVAARARRGRQAVSAAAARPRWCSSVCARDDSVSG